MGDNGKLKVVIKLKPQQPQQASGHKHADHHRRSRDKGRDKEKGKDKGQEKDRDSEKDNHRVKLKLKHTDVKSSSRSGFKHSLSAVSEDEAADKQQEAVSKENKDRRNNHKEINSSREREGPMPLKKRKFELPAASSPEPELALSPALAVVVPPTTTAATPSRSTSFPASIAHYRSKVKLSPQPSADSKDDVKVQRQDSMSVDTSAPNMAYIPEPAPPPEPSFSTREPSAAGADAPTVPAMEAILAKLQKKDTFGVFAEKVDRKLVPDYYDVIKHPMDFGTLREKLKAGVYSTWDLFTADVNLICNNAMHYNAPTTVYYKQAKAMQELLYKSLSKEQQVIARKTTAAATATAAHQSAPDVPAKRGRKPGSVPGRRGRPPGRLNRVPSDSDHVIRAVGDDSVDSRRAVRSNADTSMFEPGTPVDNDEYGERKPVSLQALDGRRPLPAEEYRRSTFVTKKPGTGRGVVCWDQLTLGQANSRVFAPVSNLPQDAYMASLCRFVGSIGGRAWAVASKKIAQVFEAEVQALTAPPPMQTAPKQGALTTKAYAQSKTATPQITAGRGTPASVRGTAQVPSAGAGRGSITAARPPTPPVTAPRVTTPPPNIATVRPNASLPAAASMQRTPSPLPQGQTAFNNSGNAMSSVSNTLSAPNPSANLGMKSSPSHNPVTAQSASVPRQPLGSVGPGRPVGQSSLGAQGNATTGTIAQRVISPNALSMPASRPQPTRPSGGNSFGFDALFNNSNSAPKMFDLNMQASFPTQRAGPTTPVSKGFAMQSNAGNSGAHQGFQATLQQQQQQQGGVQLPAGNYAYPPWMASSLAQMQQMSAPLQQQQQAMAAMLASQSGAHPRVSAPQHAQLGAMATSASVGTPQDDGASLAGQAAEAQGMKGQARQQTAGSGQSTWPIDFMLGLRPGDGSSGG
eukprot:jgi/Chlat1/6449/Chrsp45S00466